MPVLSKEQELKLQAVKAYPDKDLSVLLPKFGSRVGGSSPKSGGTLLKRKVDRTVIGSILSGDVSRGANRGAHPPKVARTDDAHIEASSLIPSAVLSPLVTLSTTPETSPPMPSDPSPSMPPTGTHVGALIQSGSMLGDPQIIRERLGRFVFSSDIQQISALGTEVVINTFLEGLAQISTASVCLFSRAHFYGQLKLNHEAVQKELVAAQGRITELEAADRASRAEILATRGKAALSEAACSKAETDLSAIREKTVKLEAELSATRERDALREVELVEAHEKATKLETELKAVHKRGALREAAFSRVEAELKSAQERASQAEVGLEYAVAGAFIDGYEELRGKISASFLDIDFSGFVPTEAPEDGGSEDAKDDEGDHDNS